MIQILCASSAVLGVSALNVFELIFTAETQSWLRTAQRQTESGYLLSSRARPLAVWF